MGQKVNPHGLRVGVIKDWDSRWFAGKATFGDTLVEDYKIRELLKKKLYIISTLTESFLTIVEPSTAFSDNFHFNSQVENFTIFRNTLAIHNVKFCFFEWW